MQAGYPGGCLTKTSSGFSFCNSFVFLTKAGSELTVIGASPIMLPSVKGPGLSGS